LADYYSRIVDYDDWMINPIVFQWLDTLWGTHTVDRFSSPENSQLDRFNSRFWTPGYETVDAFTCDLAEDNNWWSHLSIWFQESSGMHRVQRPKAL